MNIETDTFTCRGIREENQDSYFAGTDYLGKKQVGLFCVSDGMGGLQSGQIASSMAIQEVSVWWEETFGELVQFHKNSDFIVSEMKKLFLKVNQRIRSAWSDRKDKMGTTMSMLVLIDQRYYYCHCGDSRIYAFNSGNLSPITTDHTYVNHMRTMGYTDIPEKKKNVLTSCIGILQEPEIEFGYGMVKNMEGFLLCSDGVYNWVDEMTMHMICMQDRNPSKALVDLAIENGGTDNATAVCVSLKQNNGLISKIFASMKGKGS